MKINESLALGLKALRGKTQNWVQKVSTVSSYAHGHGFKPHEGPLN